MPVLKIFTLGPLLICKDDQPVDTFKTSKVQALLIYLAVEKDRKHPRESLMELLWPDMPLESAQVNLRQTIYRLRQAIPGVQSTDNEKLVSVINSDRQSISINPDAQIILDTEHFLRDLDSNPEQAVKLYRGDFLTDFYLADSNPFELWAGQIRQMLKNKALLTLSTLTDEYIEKGLFEQAQEYAWRQLEIDNLRERAYRQLMTALANSGQRSAALSQFQLCQSRLERELGLKPSQETINLYKKIQIDALSQVSGAISAESKRTDQRMPVFLLTDIEGSTRLWDQYHEAMLSALFTHNNILETRISQHGGRILELRGDGVKAVFESGDPLACVLDIQRDFRNMDWGQIGDLRIRIGLHGLPTIYQGYDYFKENDQYYGPVLNHTARIMDAGWGGQILVSEQVRNECSLPKNACWVDHGLHSVKSLDKPIHIFELSDPDLDAISFPPLRTMSSQPQDTNGNASGKVSNIPPQRTTFIGRENEVNQLVEFLKSSDNRLLTIVGAGGIGKTRLAIATAEKILNNQSAKHQEKKFTDGVFFIPLAPLNSIDQLVPAIINNLNIPIEISQTTERGTTAGPSLKEKVISFLLKKRMLIILDNFEHLIEGASFISEIYESCPNLHLIITSRERLHLQEEQIFPIFGLEYPEMDSTENYCDYSAIELFHQSARRVKPDFELDPEEFIHLIKICHLIGGMPLGLEIAASWVDLLTVEEIAEEIKKNLDFLETEIRNIPERHRSIRAVFDSSWQYLTDLERKIYPRFSVFRGGFSREAAKEITGATIRNLGSFVNKSLIQYNESEGHYYIHELLRQYGHEYLSLNSPDRVQTLENYSAYFSKIVKREMDRFLKSGSPVSFQNIKANLSNILEAWNWSIGQEDIANIDHMIGGLCIYYDWNWQSQDGLRLCNSAIDLLSSVESTPNDLNYNQDEQQNIKRIISKVLSFKAMFTLYFDANAAVKILLESKSILDKLHQENVPANYENAQVLFFLGVAKFYLGDFRIAKDHFLQSLAITEQTHYEFVVLRNLFGLGDIARVLGFPREAEDWYQKSLNRARLKQNEWGELVAINNLGWAARIMMDYEKARQMFEENLALAKAYDNPYEIIRAYESLGFLAIFLGNFIDAIDSFSKAVSISMEFGIQNRAIASKVHISVSHWLSGNFDEAEPAIEAAVALTAKSSSMAKFFPGICRAEFFIMIGSYHQAAYETSRINMLVNKYHYDRFLLGRYKRTLGWLALTEKNYQKAEELFSESLDLYQTITDDEQIAWSQAGLGRALIGQGRIDEAKGVLTDALWTTIEIKAFIPLLFILPIAELLLYDENPKLAVELFPHIQESPFLSKSKLIEDIAFQYLPLDLTSITEENQISEKEVKSNLWKAASSILSNWMQIWIEEPVLVTKNSSSRDKKNGINS